MRPPRLEDSEIKERMKALDGWQAEDDGSAIARRFRFADFRRAFAFMTECALVAEKLDHHPEWSNTYSTVSVRLTTHSAKGLTQLDFELAAAMDAAAARAGVRSGN